MKKYLLILPILALFIITACGPAKVAEDPYVGSWNVIIKDTPQGNVGSIMTIVKNSEGTGYEASVKSDMGNFNLQDLIITQNNLNSNLEIQGMVFDFKGTFNGDSFNGLVSGEGGEFTAEGNRVVEKEQ